MHDEAGLEGLIERLRVLGLLERIGLVHLNDSKTPFGLKRDQHENLGEGLIGYEGLARVVRHPALAHVPFVLEVPGADGHGPDAANMALAKSMRAASAGAPGRATARVRERARRLQSHQLRLHLPEPVKNGQSDRPRPAFAYHVAAHPDDGQHVLEGRRGEHLAAGRRLRGDVGDPERPLLYRPPHLAGDLDDVQPGYATQYAVAQRVSAEHTVQHREHVGRSPLAHDTLRVEEQGFVGAGLLGLFFGQDGSEQVGGLDVAAGPTLVVDGMQNRARRGSPPRSEAS